ncbi:p21-activated protein kinase-interacting protein 1-like isoform X1 [Colletes gigas]|uniref:p21-activated protein kinase-interacting protein 1-like isoform X1 n=1 Tax=Colletes gigas TaxID=935657 RepID=UPI001C9A5252|nr:p21-activated protein kinase-interacting protein 1-like isoform X1 [Colletes gigas]
MVRLDANVSNPFEIIVGTYEQYLLGYKVNNIVNEYTVERSFATHSHVASVRSIGSNKHYLASGGADDSICLYDMHYRIQSGKLVHHNDTVNCIAFTPEASHMFSCSNDGTIAAVRCGNWQLEKQWLKPHKGLAVNTFAIHPTGKLALSTGADGILRTWNLIKGRQAYATNLVPRLKLDARNVTVLKWSPNGEKYLLAANQRIDIYSIELAGVDSEIQFDSKIVCVEFLRDDLIAVGLDNGRIKFYDLEKSVQTVDAIGHDIRVKCMAFKNDLLVTASSSGEIKLWKYSKHRLDMLQSVNCAARITCLALAMPYKSLSQVDEAKAEEEEKVVERKKFRLRQEVVIEKEGDWEVTPIDDSRTVSTGKKSKKKRRMEEEQAPNVSDKKRFKTILKKKKLEEDEVESIPRKKKKSSNVEDRNNGSGKKKKRSASTVECERKQSSLQAWEVDSVPVHRPTKKLMRSLKNDEISSKKKKKKAVVDEAITIPTKKKKKQ